MRVLVDTNVLIRSVQKNESACRIARQALVSLYRGEHTLFLATQNVAEFWNVCTRPDGTANGLGLSIEATDRYINQLEQFFTILPDSLHVFQIWRSLVVAHSVRGAKVHDTRLVAMMRANDIPKIVTFNVADFTRFSEIESLHPKNVI